MKKVILAGLLVMASMSVAQAVTKKVVMTNATTVFVNTVCIDGKLFAVATKTSSMYNSSAASSGVALTQVFERGEYGVKPHQPVTCKEVNK